MSDSELSRQLERASRSESGSSSVGTVSHTIPVGTLLKRRGNSTLSPVKACHANGWNSGTLPPRWAQAAFSGEGQASAFQLAPQTLAGGIGNKSLETHELGSASLLVQVAAVCKESPPEMFTSLLRENPAKSTDSATCGQRVPQNKWINHLDQEEGL